MRSSRTSEAIQTLTCPKITFFFTEMYVDTSLLIVIDVSLSDSSFSCLVYPYNNLNAYPKPLFVIRLVCDIIHTSARGNTIRRKWFRPGDEISLRSLTNFPFRDIINLLPAEPSITTSRSTRIFDSSWRFEEICTNQVSWKPMARVISFIFPTRSNFIIRSTLK